MAQLVAQLNCNQSDLQSNTQLEPVKTIDISNSDVSTLFRTVFSTSCDSL
jgi:hypothetical protein